MKQLRRNVVEEPTRDQIRFDLDPRRFLGARVTKIISSDTDAILHHAIWYCGKFIFFYQPEPHLEILELKQRCIIWPSLKEYFTFAECGDRVEEVTLHEKAPQDLRTT